MPASRVFIAPPSGSRRCAGGMSALLSSLCCRVHRRAPRADDTRRCPPCARRAAECPDRPAAHLGLTRRGSRRDSPVSCARFCACSATDPVPVCGVLARTLASEEVGPADPLSLHSLHSSSFFFPFSFLSSFPSCPPPPFSPPSPLSPSPLALPPPPPFFPSCLLGQSPSSFFPPCPLSPVPPALPFSPFLLPRAVPPPRPLLALRLFLSAS